PRLADPVGVAGGAVHQIEEDERHAERDDAQVDVAQASVEHEVAEQRREGRRQHDGHHHRYRALAEVHGGHRVGVGAEPIEGRLAEAEDAAVAPDHAEAEGQDAHGREHGELQQVERLGHHGHAHRDGQHGGGREPDPQPAAQPAHELLRKNRPVMPWGRTRKRMMAAASSPASPMTGVVKYVSSWLTEPNTAAAEAVPASMAVPPLMTVMNALAT